MGRAIGVEQREDGLAGPLESGMAEYLVGPEVDRGGFSVIRVAQNKEAKSIVAIKSTLRSLADPSEALSGQADTSECSAQIRREGHLLCRLDHPNIVRCLGIAREGADAHLVLEFLSGGDLANCLKRQGPLREAQARRGARALLSALAHMHRCARHAGRRGPAPLGRCPWSRGESAPPPPPRGPGPPPGVARARSGRFGSRSRAAQTGRGAPRHQALQPGDVEQHGPRDPAHRGFRVGRADLGARRRVPA